MSELKWNGDIPVTINTNVYVRLSNSPMNIFYFVLIHCNRLFVLLYARIIKRLEMWNFQKPRVYTPQFRVLRKKSESNSKAF